MLTAPNLERIPYLEHGFCTAAESEALKKTHKKHLLLLKQAHDDGVIFATSLDIGQDVEADAMAAIEPELMLGIKTADCVPVLLADKERQVIGAIHAGWKGALKGIVKNGVKAMLNLGATPERIVAAVGPSIRFANYEVGKEFYNTFMEYDPEAEVFFTTDKKYFNLPEYVKSKLFEEGIEDTFDTDINTYTDTNFMSYRRDNKDQNRNISWIKIKQ